MSAPELILHPAARFYQGVAADRSISPQDFQHIKQALKTAANAAVFLCKK